MPYSSLDSIPPSIRFFQLLDGQVVSMRAFDTNGAANELDRAFGGCVPCIPLNPIDAYNKAIRFGEW